MLSFDYCPIGLWIVRKAGLRRQIPLVSPAESQCSGFLFIRVPETDQHEKHKAGNRKDGQRKQNTANHWCPLFSHPLPSITLERSSREKGRSSSTLSPAACAYLLLAAFLRLGGLHGAG